MIFQLVLIAFALFAIGKTWKQYQKKEASKYWVMAFSVLWVVVIIVTAVPNITSVIASTVGIGRGADVIVYSAIVILTYIVYRLMLKQQKLSAEMTDLVRAIAIEKTQQP